MACSYILSLVCSGHLLWQYNPKCIGCEEINMVFSKSQLLDGQRRSKSERWLILCFTLCFLFLLSCSLWVNSSSPSPCLPFEEGGVCSCIGSALCQEQSTPDDDVLEEENKVKQQLTEGLVDANIAVQIRGLAKTYPGTRSIGCCFKCKRTSPYNAVKVKHFLFLCLIFMQQFFGIMNSW